MRYLMVGSVVEIETGRPRPELRVTVFDSACKEEHHIGEELTAHDGSFHMWFLEDQFDLEKIPKLRVHVVDRTGKKLLRAAGPSLHIRVADAKGNELFRTSGPIPMSVIEKNHLQIEIPEGPPEENETTPDRHPESNPRPEHCFSCSCHGLRGLP